jgi:tetratricopeptide (TPR) repeat protein
MRDYFDILQIPGSATDKEIEQAYRNMLRQYPPQEFPERNRDIEEAYKMICDPVTKTACIEFYLMEPESKQIYFEAQQSIIDNKPGEAVKLLEKTLDSEQHKDHLFYLLGIAYMIMGKPRKAVRIFEQVIGNYPDDINLKIYFSKACLDARQYKKAIESAKIGYESGKNNFLAVYCLVEGYIYTKKYNKASDVLKEAFENPAFQDRRYNICAKLSYSLFLNGLYEESLIYMERLKDQEADEDEILESGTMFLEILDYFIDNQMFPQAGRCAEMILKLLPERSDIAELRKNIETILRLEPEYSKFEEDDFIPDGLKGLIANEIFTDTMAGLSPEQITAYTVLNEYHILSDYSRYLMALRYMKNKYPGLYSLKTDFLDALQNTKERKKLTNKNKALFYQYQNIIEDLMENWADEYDDVDGGDVDSESGEENNGEDDGKNHR